MTSTHLSYNSLAGCVNNDSKLVNPHNTGVMSQCTTNACQMYLLSAKTLSSSRQPQALAQRSQTCKHSSVLLRQYIRHHPMTHPRDLWHINNYWNVKFIWWFFRLSMGCLLEFELKLCLFWYLALMCHRNMYCLTIFGNGRFHFFLLWPLSAFPEKRKIEDLI